MTKSETDELRGQSLWCVKDKTYEVAVFQGNEMLQRFPLNDDVLGWRTEA